jgi:hypothetical protein
MIPEGESSNTNCKLYLPNCKCPKCEPPLRPQRRYEDENHRLDIPLDTASLFIGLTLLCIGYIFFEWYPIDNYLISGAIRFYWVLLTFPALVAISIFLAAASAIWNTLGLWTLGIIIVILCITK